MLWDIEVPEKERNEMISILKPLIVISETPLEMRMQHVHIFDLYENERKKPLVFYVYGDSCNRRSSLENISEMTL